MIIQARPGTLTGRSLFGATTTPTMQVVQRVSPVSVLYPKAQTTPLDQQAAMGRERLKDYVNELAEWRKAQAQFRATALRNIPQLYILAYFACRRKYHDRSFWRQRLATYATESVAKIIDSRSNGCPSVDKYSDVMIGYMASATDDWEAKGTTGMRFNPDVNSEGWNPMQGNAGQALDSKGNPYPVVLSDQSQPHARAWELLHDGIYPNEPITKISGEISHPNEFDLTTVVVQWGLKGLYYYCDAVPAVRLLSRLANVAPDWSVTKMWMERLVPLVADGVTQEQLDAWSGAYTYSNPLIRQGDVRGLASEIRSAVQQLSQTTPDMPTESALPSWLLPALLLAGTATAAYFLLRKPKSSGGGAK